MSAAVEKIKEVLHVNHHTNGHATHNTHNTHNTVPEGTAGPHNTRVANAADPRVDSDLDSTRNGGAYGTTGTTGFNGTSGGVSHSTNAGPHNSNLLNKADPRVDSDLDSTRNGGAYGTTGTGFNGTSAGASHSTNAGPHNSNLLNKVDPRVDSDRDGSRNLGAATGTTGATAYNGSATGNHATGNHFGGTTGTVGGISNSTNAGPHDSNALNKLDPRVDSDLDGRGNRQGANKTGIFGASGSHATPGTGTAQNTAGPHNKDIENKLDPRVDSDLDGSKTFGGNRTQF